MATKLAVAMALVLLTGSAVAAVQFQQTWTFAYNNAAAVTTETTQAVWIMGNNACTIDSDGGPQIDPECGEGVSANWTSALQTMHWFPSGECLDWAEGYHNVIRDDGPDLSDVTVDSC